MMMLTVDMLHSIMCGTAAWHFFVTSSILSSCGLVCPYLAIRVRPLTLMATKKDLKDKTEFGKINVAELMFDREIPPDPRDPRTTPSWTCQGHHLASQMQANKSGAWSHCLVCNLRLRYIPKRGAPSNQLKNHNPAVVQKMIDELPKELNPGTLPTHELCEHYILKLLEEERIAVLLEQVNRITRARSSQEPTAKKKGENPPKTHDSAGYTAERPPTTPRSSPDSWEQVSPNAVEFNLMDYLTEQEKVQVMQRAAQRMNVDRSPGLDPEMLDPPYSE